MDPLCPAPPQPPSFDSTLRALVLSRHADVIAALHEPALRQESAPGKDSEKPPNVRAHLLDALSPAKLKQWQRAMDRSACEIIATLPANCRVDLLGDVIRPWTLDLAILTLRDGPAHRRRLQRLAHGRSAAKSRLRSKLANLEFKLFFRGRLIDKSVFIGVSETLPAFLANAWVALLRDPGEFARLRSHPELIPPAIEEFLRYSGLVHSLVRVASADTSLAGVQIAAGDKVILKLASANHDPEQFPDPDRLDIARCPAGHLALGHGEHSCVGALLLRAASTALTRALITRFAGAQIEGEIEWRWGGTLVSPASLPAVLISH